MNADLGRLRHARLPDLFPTCGPWTTAALLHGFDDGLPLPDADLLPEIDVIRRQKLSPLLLHLLRQRRPDWTPAGLDDLRQDAVLRVSRSGAVAVAARAVAADLAAAGIGAVITKGAGIARHYRWPRVRTSTDVDLLVAPSQFRAAFELMTREGRWGELTRSLQPWPGFHRWCREAANLVARNGDCVDLHHTASPWLWANGLDHATVSAAGLESDGVLLAGGADNLAIAALQLIGDHATPGTKLIAWRDLAELGTTLEPDATAARLAHTRTAGTVRWLLTQLPEAMQPLPLLAALPDIGPERPRRLDAMVTTARSGHSMATHAVRIPPLNAVAYVAGTLVPSPGFRTWKRGVTTAARTLDHSPPATSGKEEPHG